MHHASRSRPRVKANVGISGKISLWTVGHGQAKPAKKQTDKERAQGSRDDLDLPPLTPEEEAYEKACDAIVDARLVSKFGLKSKFTDEEILTAVDELEAEDAFPDPPN